MDNAVLYSTYNFLQRSGSKYALDNYFHLMKRQDYENILDVGCGDGGVTLELLLPKLPKNFKKLVGLDISQEMLDFAKSRCKNQSKIDFIRLDISTSAIPMNLYQHFDHIFSSYCLHWVVPEKQRQALRNLFDMLKPGGDVLLAIVTSSPVFEVYENMVLSSKWAPYMTNLERYISPYHHSVDPAKTVEEILKDLGFVNCLCEVMNEFQIFQNFPALWKWFCSINPFIKKIPSDILDIYKKESMDELWKVAVRTQGDKGTAEEIRFPNNLVIVVASKSS